MENQKLFEMINLYFDGELEKGEEAILFAQLSLSEKGRSCFKQLNQIKAAVEESIEEFPEELDERILKSVKRVNSKKPLSLRRTGIYASISYTFALILIIISGLLFIEVKDYQNKVEKLSDKMIMQSHTIQMLYNSLPDIEVKASSNNEIIVKPGI